MHTKLYHLFFLKKNKRPQGESSTIYLRITVDGKRAELSTGKINWTKFLDAKDCQGEGLFQKRKKPK